jgi:uncharacterized protein with von Willebrand factor type A (vWA) domain
MTLGRESSGRNTAAEEKDGLLQGVLGFAAFLRENGLEITTAETLDSVSSLPLVDITVREQFYYSLRATFVKRSEDYPLFDQLFRVFWKGERIEVPSGRPPSSAKEQSSTGRARVTIPGEVVQSRRLTAPPSSDSGGRDSTGEKAIFAIYSPAEMLGERDLGSSSAGSSMPRRLVKRLSRRLATRRGRRFEASKRGLIDLRRTLRSGLGSGGQFAELLRRRRKISRSDLVVLCDISGSMDSHSVRLLRLLHHFCNATNAEVFAFSTQLVRLNPYLRGSSLASASRLISKNVTFWSSGTRIGSTLGKLREMYQGYLTSSTVLVIISDGWELDDLSVLESNLRLVRSRVNDIIWFNPLADDPGYRPLAAGMSMALPHIGIFAGLRALENRQEFDRVFGKELTPLLSR